MWMGMQREGWDLMSFLFTRKTTTLIARNEERSAKKRKKNKTMNTRIEKKSGRPSPKKAVRTLYPHR